MEERTDVEQALKWPGLALILVGVTDLLWSIFSLLGQPMMQAWMEEAAKEGDADPAVLEMLEAMGQPGGFFYWLLLLLGFGITALVILGGAAMMRQRGWVLALVGSILACVPCMGPCCGLSIPFGVWAIVILMRPEVKAAMSGSGSAHGL